MHEGRQVNIICKPYGIPDPLISLCLISSWCIDESIKSFEIPFFISLSKQSIIKFSTSCCLFAATPSRPAAKTNSLCEVSRPVKGERDLPKSVFSRVFLSGEAELSRRIFEIKMHSNSSIGSWLSPRSQLKTTWWLSSSSGKGL